MWEKRLNLLKALNRDFSETEAKTIWYWIGRRLAQYRTIGYLTESILEELEDGPKTHAELSEATQYGKRQVAWACEVLLRMGLVNVLRRRERRTKEYWLAADPFLIDQDLIDIIDGAVDEAIASPEALCID